jgi:predicted nucleotidyltransferase
MAEIASLDDLRIRFGTSTPRRQFLFRQLEIVIDQLLITRSVKQIYLFGSFVSGKASPNDVDLLVVMNAGFSTTQLGGKVLELFQHDVCRIRYQADLFWVTEVVGNARIEDHC